MCTCGQKFIKTKDTQTHCSKQCTLKSPECRRKCIETCLERYGVESVNHDPNIAERLLEACFKTNSYNLGKRTVSTQGYEHHVLNYLRQELGIRPAQIEVARSKVPPVFYLNNEKKHRYFPDISVASLNLLIEVKSTWTLSMNPDVYKANQEKAKACRAKGFNFLMIVVVPKSKSSGISAPLIITMPKLWYKLSFTKIKKFLKAAIIE